MSQRPKSTQHDVLQYPFGALAPGEAREVASGVIWARLPSPGRIDHVNVYLLRDEDGWTLVDTGSGDQQTEEMLARVLDRELRGAPIVRVLCTHMHPSHVGQAGWVCRRHDAPLWMSRLEYLSARVLSSDRPPAPQEAVDFLVAAGWSADWLDDFSARYGAYGDAVRALPQSYVRVEDRDDLEIGGRTWRVITGAGHSPEHVCLWQPDLKLFIAGDQALPATPTVVSAWPSEPAGDPLSDWLSSCWRLMAAIPEDVLALPSRDAPFEGLHARLEEIIAASEARLDRLKSALDRPRRVVDLFATMFPRAVAPRDRGMATGETIAHLNYLERKGRVRCAFDDAGVAWFELDPAGEEADEDAFEAL
jgi:glyoxylase-like metal-dependent hydrolase (beta-lactamase superfamily II)